MPKVKPRRCTLIQAVPPGYGMARCVKEYGHRSPHSFRKTTEVKVKPKRKKRIPWCDIPSLPPYRDEHRFEIGSKRCYCGRTTREVKKPKKAAPVKLSRKQALDNLFLAGNLMSNLCFNLSQQSGKYQSDFREAFLTWDKARSDYWKHLAASRGVRPAKE